MRNMKKKNGVKNTWIVALTVLLLIGPLFSGSVAAEEEWHKADIGSGDSGMYDVDVGLGRNEDIMRVYGVNRDYNIYEFSYIEGTWNKMDVGMGTIANPTNSITVGTGRYDGVIRVYTTQFGGFDEFTFSGGTWTRVHAGYNMWGVALGDGRNDGMPRVYGADEDDSIYEFTYSNGEWNQVDIGSGMNDMRGVAVGEARNDDFVRVYGANDDCHVYEFTYENETWTKVDLGGVPSPMRAVSIGDGRNDGIMRVYAANVDGHIYEFTYSGDSWAVVDIGYGGSEMHSIAIGAGRNDTVERVYGANGDGHIYEFSYFADTWTKKNVGKGNSYMRGVAVGDGRNDEVIRVYGANEDGHIYEFSYEVEIPPTVSITTDKCEYCTGDTMNVTLDIINPTSDAVRLEWYLWIPQFSFSIPMAKATMPPGFDDTYITTIEIGDWGATPFSAIWFVHLLDAGSGEVLCHDSAYWMYTGKGKATPANLAEQINKTIERIELPS